MANQWALYSFLLEVSLYCHAQVHLVLSHATKYNLLNHQAGHAKTCKSVFQQNFGSAKFFPTQTKIDQ